VAGSLKARVVAALAGIENPRLENDLLSAGMIRDLAVTEQGDVSFTFLLAAEDPATLVCQARAAVQAVEGARRDEIKITVTNPAGPARTTTQFPAAPAPSGRRADAHRQPNLGRIIAVPPARAEGEARPSPRTSPWPWRRTAPAWA
jgi:metal-sulfur cluster biosynthetic enzyme